ncbi:MAG: hypothetical protein ABJA34_03130 [Pseudonocardiales bacterium]
MQVRSISNDEGNKLLRIVRRSSGSVVTWRRAQLVLLSAQGMDAVKIAEITFTPADLVRDVLHNFNADGFESLARCTAVGGTGISPTAAAGDREDRAGQADRSRLAVLDLEPAEAGGLPGHQGGGRRQQP